MMRYQIFRNARDLICHSTKNIFIAAGILFCPFVLPAIAQTNTDHIVLFIANKETDSLKFNEYDIKFRTKDLQILFPNSRIVVIYETTNEKVRDKLKFAVEKATIIDGIYFDSEGKSFYWVDGKEVQHPESRKERLSSAAAYIGTESGGIHFYLTDPNQTQDLLGLALEKLAPDAKIIFNVCELLKVGDTAEEKLTIAHMIALNLKMKPGNSLYLSETRSGDFKEKFNDHPVIIRGDSVGNDAFRLLTHLAPFISDPIVSEAESVWNKGFLLKVGDIKEEKHPYELFRDTLYNTRTNRAPSGVSVQALNFKH
ncbi:MAG: hypothetical protein JWQ35_210 [Bacteriovoracaceae bacterium]|nr:hypothetical protein [Bacteriovoracaceae bacterium]